MEIDECINVVVFTHFLSLTNILYILTLNPVASLTPIINNNDLN